MLLSLAVPLVSHAGSSTTPAAADRTVSVQVDGGLPGLPPAKTPEMLARIMAGRGGGVHFLPTPPNPAGVDRIEWRLAPKLYTHGHVLSLGPPRSELEEHFGEHPFVSVEARLYRNGQYVTMIFGQIDMPYGRVDRRVSTFFQSMTDQLLRAGESLQSMEHKG